MAMQCQKCAEERYVIQSRVGKRIGDLAPASWDGKLGKTLSNWWELDFKSFQAQIKKIFKRDIPVSERDQWDSYLSTERQKVETLTAQIQTLESEINSNVYQLFNLTAEEIKLIENTN